MKEITKVREAFLFSACRERAEDLVGLLGASDESRSLGQFLEATGSGVGAC